MREVDILLEDADEHEIGGVRTRVIIDVDARAPHSSDPAWMGRQSIRRVAAVDASVLSRPVPGSTLSLDGEPFTVVDAAVEARLLILTLSQECAVTTTTPTFTGTLIHYTESDGYSAPVESGRESDIPLRVTWQAETITTSDGRAVRVSGQVAIAAAAVAMLSVGDQLVIAGIPGIWRIAATQDTRDYAGNLVQWQGWLATGFADVG